MLQSVSTLWTTVGLPCQPRSAGNGGRADTVPRKPWSDASSAVSSPTTYEPAPSSISTSNENPLPWMSSPRSPGGARALDRLAQQRQWSAGTRSGRTRSPARAPTAYAASAMPSRSSSGLRSIRSLSMYEPGSPSSPLTTITLSGSLAFAANSHLVPAGNPAPPRPRTSAALTSASSCSGVMLASAWRRPVEAAGREQHRLVEHAPAVRLAAPARTRPPPPGRPRPGRRRPGRRRAPPPPCGRSRGTPSRPARPRRRRSARPARARGAPPPPPRARRSPTPSTPCRCRPTRGAARAAGSRSS